MKKAKIYKAAVSVLGIVFFVVAFVMCCRMETETMMPITYKMEGKVIHNEYINRNEWIVSVKDMETSIVYDYYADRPVNLLTEVTLEMHSKGTLDRNDDGVIDRLK